MATRLNIPTPVGHFRLGLVFAVTSALAFGTSGPLGKSLVTAGWSPTAAVAARLGLGALAMAAVATAIKRNWVRDALAHPKTVIAYGVAPIAGAQLCYYNAVAHLAVGVALLLEYTAPLLVVGWMWATTRRRPSALVMAGVGLAVTGTTLVLGVLGPGGPATARVDLVGVGWGLAAAICAASYFLMSGQVARDDDEDRPHSVTLAAGGLTVGAIAVALLGLTGVLPIAFTGNDVVIGGQTTSWVVPVILLALVPTALAYPLGILGIARLRPRFASLVGLAEVLFAVLAAWALLGEAVTAEQAIGGAVVLGGLALARLGDRSEEVARAGWPEAPAGQMRCEQTIRRPGADV